MNPTPPPSVPVTLYPAALDLCGAAVLVVGAGAVGLRKIQGLLPTGARLTVVAPAACAAVQRLASQGLLTWEAVPFQGPHLTGKRLVFVCTGDPALNTRIAEQARAAGAWVNVASGEGGDLVVPAHLRRGDLLVGVNTSVAALSARLREELEEQFDIGYDGLVQFLRGARARLQAEVADQDVRRKILQCFLAGVSTHELARYSEERLQERLEQCISSFSA